MNEIRRIMKRTGAVLLLLVLLLGLSGCGKTAARSAFLNGCGLGERLTQAITREVGAPFILEEPVLEKLAPDSVMAVLDTTGTDAAKTGIAEYWTPLFDTAIVICVDRTQTDAKITGWQDLAAAGERVDIFCPVEHAMSASAYAMAGREYTMEDCVGVFRPVFSAGLLSREDTGAPIQICFAFTAQERQLRGEHVDIVYPKEGTLSYTAGLLSQRKPDAGMLREAISKAGFPLSLPEEVHTLVYPAAGIAGYTEKLTAAGRIYGQQIKREIVQGYGVVGSTALPTVLCILVISWLPTVLMRTRRREARRICFALCFLIVFWFTVRIVKYILLDPVWIRALWYCFYLPMLGIPLCLYGMASILDQEKIRNSLRRRFAVLSGVGAVLLGFVATNDLHQQVFRLGSWGDEGYTYRWGYYVVAAYCVILLVAACITMLQKARKSPKRNAWLLPLGIFAAFTVYGVLYAARVFYIDHTDLTSVMCIMACLFFEACLRSGWIPNNTRYRQLFWSSPLRMQLVTPDGQPVLLSATAAPVEQSVWARLQAAPDQPIPVSEDMEAIAHPIPGGYVVWDENIRGLRLRREALAGTQERLSRTNEMIAREASAGKSAMEKRLQNEVYSQMEEETRQRTQALSEMIRALPDSDRPQADAAKITMQLCYLKRRCNLYFIRCGNAPMNGMDLQVYLEELAEFGTYCGVKCRFNGLFTQPIPPDAATMVYDFCFDCILWLAQAGGGMLLMTLSTENGAPAVGVLGGEQFSDFRPGSGTVQAIGQCGYHLETPEMEEGYALRMRRGEEGRL